MLGLDFQMDQYAEVVTALESLSDEDHALSLTHSSEIVANRSLSRSPLFMSEAGEVERAFQAPNHKLTPRSSVAKRQFERATLTGR